MADSREKILINTFTPAKGRPSGLWKDSLLSLQPQGTYSDAWGAVFETDEESMFGIANESSNELCATLPEDHIIRGYHFVEERDWHIVFSMHKDSGFSEIGYIDTNRCQYVRILNDNEITGCNLCFSSLEWVQSIESKVVQPCNELYLYWSNKDTYYRIQVTNKNKPVACEDIQLFDCKCIPSIEATVSEKGGVDLEAGAYQYVAQLEDEDGNTTNWFRVSNAVHLGSENNNPGELSEQAVSVRISRLNKSYNKVNIGVVTTIGGVVSAKRVSVEYYSKSGVEFFHTSKDQNLGEIPFEEILIRKNGFIKGKGLIQFDGRLFLYGVRGERNLDMQERLEQVQVKYKMGRVPVKYAHLFNGLRGNEVYNFAVQYNYCDGTHTPAFPLINTRAASAAGGKSCGNCDDKNSLNNSNRTATFTSTSDNYEVSISKDDDTYERFTPTDQNLIGDEDINVPDYSDVPDAGEGGEGDGCDCVAFSSDIWTDVAGQAIIDFNLANNPSEKLAALQLFTLACGCVSSTSGESESEATESIISLSDLDPKEVSELLNARTAFEQDPGDPPVYTEEIVSKYLESKGISESAVEDETGSGDTSEDVATIGDSNGDCPFLSAPDDPGAGNGGVDSAPNASNSEDDISSGSSEKECEQDTTTGGNPPDANTPSIVNPPANDKPKTTYSGTTEGRVIISGNPSSVNDCSPTIIYKDGECCEIEKIIPCIDAEGEFGVYESCETYPETKKCCDEGYVYGQYAGQPLKFFKAPSRQQEPHFISKQDGVPTLEAQDNKEWRDGYARFIWPAFSNIPLPSTDELDKPLCPENPVTILIAERTESNKSVKASGLLLNTFEGNVFNETYAVPRHGVNSVETVDRWINNNGGRLGQSHSTGHYVFHSPDTHFDKPSLNIDKVEILMDIYGKGFRHGIYAEGRNPQSPFVAKENRKGARSQVNLNHYDTSDYGGDGAIRCVKAIDYAPANEVVDKGANFSKGLLNLNRESCVFIETEENATQWTDDSFVGNVNQHRQPIQRAAALYADLIIQNPNQYGSLESATYFPLWEVDAVDLAQGEVIAMAGDAYINTFSIKRTSYVSDRVDEDLVPDFEFGGGIGNIPIIGNILKRMLSDAGAGAQCGTVPKSGSTIDPRNNNNLNGLRNTGFQTPNISTQKNGTNDSDNDTYYPQTQTTLVTFFAESDVNLKFRGGGDTPETAHYRDLNGLNLDSSFSGGDGAYKNSWLDRYYATMTENPKWKMILRVVFNLLFTYGVGIWLIIKGTTLAANIIGAIVAGLVFSIGTAFALVSAGLLIFLGAKWIQIWSNTNLDNKFWDDMLGIQDCYPDVKIGTNTWKMHDAKVQGLEDNYYRYSYDFSVRNKFEATQALPDPYNTCECLNERVHDILYSNKQVPSSSIDAYRNFQANNYIDIPTHTGPIKNMFSRADRLYVHTSDMMWSLRTGNASLSTGDGSEVFLGRGDVLQVPVPLFGGPREGYGGLLDPNASVNSVWGYMFLDREARKVFMFSGGQISEISTFGVSNFLKENMDFDLLEYYPDFKVVDQRIGIGVGYNLGVDYRHNRLLITKRDFLPKDPDNTKLNSDGITFTVDGNKVFANDPRYFYDRSWTLSYSPETQTWISFHWYKPDLYLWDRFKMLTIKDDGVWTHNVPGDFQRFYGTQYPFIVEYVARDHEQLDPFKFVHTSLDTEAYTYENPKYIRSTKETFNEIVCYNGHQSTGAMEIVDVDNTSIPERTKLNNQSGILPISFQLRRWRFSKVLDRLISFGDFMFEPDLDFGPKSVNSDNIGDIKNNILTDNHLVTRLKFDKFTNVKLFLKFTKTKVDIEED